MRKSGKKEKKEQKRKTKDEVKNENVKYLQEIDVFENDELDNRVEKPSNSRGKRVWVWDYHQVKNEGNSERLV